MSTHEVLVVKINTIENHPNADSLDIIKLFDGGYTAIVRKGDFKIGDLAIYIEPDYVVPPGPRFSFLDKPRIRCKRLRGVWSQGLLIPVLETDASFVEGMNVIKELEIVRHVPTPMPSKYIRTKGLVQSEKEVSFRSSELRDVPKLLVELRAYDIENIRKNVKAFTVGEEIIATEKIHGQNSRFTWNSKENKMFCGSREQWKEDVEDCSWWVTLRNNPWIETFCKAHPDYILYGEIFGQIQDLKYGAGPSDIFFRVFDVLTSLSNEETGWWDYEKLEEAFTAEQLCPVVYRGPFDFEKLHEVSLGDSLIPGAKHLSEGIVVRPTKERRQFNRRVFFKFVSDRFLEKSKD